MKRDFKAMVDQGEPTAAIGNELLCVVADLFLW
jgi:hypothetical protein